jgi:hypothetical protein
MSRKTEGATGPGRRGMVKAGLPGGCARRTNPVRQFPARICGKTTDPATRSRGVFSFSPTSLLRPGPGAPKRTSPVPPHNSFSREAHEAVTRNSAPDPPIVFTMSIRVQTSCRPEKEHNKNKMENQAPNRNKLSESPGSAGVLPALSPSPNDAPDRPVSPPVVHLRG